jgi:hypothetical protein
MAIQNPSRLMQDANVGVRAEVHDLRWATKALAAAALPLTTDFFTGAPSTDPCSDRFSAGSLADSGCSFTIVGLGVHLWSQVAAALADIDKIINECSIRMTTNQREIMTIPVFMLPAGGGLSAPGGQVAVTAAASPGGTSPYGVTNGVPDRRAMFRLAQPQTIQPMQQFKCELVAPSGGGAYAAITLGTIVNCRIVLDGVLRRVAG